MVVTIFMVALVVGAVLGILHLWNVMRLDGPYAAKRHATHLDNLEESLRMRREFHRKLSEDERRWRAERREERQEHLDNLFRHERPKHRRP